MNLNIKYIPAETKVAEWIKAEAGTGASIESGSQEWKPNCADLQNEHTTNNNNNTSFIFIPTLKKKNVYLNRLNWLDYYYKNLQNLISMKLKLLKLNNNHLIY